MTKNDEYEIPDETNPKKTPIEESELDTDYRFSRMTYYKLISSGFDVLERMQELVKESDHPRAYEVYGGLMGKISEINGQLLDMQRKQQVLKQDRGQVHTEVVSPEKRIVFNGTATEIQHEMKRERLANEAVEAANAAEAELAKIVEVPVEEIVEETSEDDGQS